MVDNSQQITKYSSSDLLMNPKIGLYRMQGLLQKYGQEKVLKSIKFQQERELWIGSVFALASEAYTGKTYWLKANPKKSDAPDIFMHSYRDPLPHEKGIVREVVNLEILEYESHANTSTAQHILNKKLKKGYPPYFTILCYIHGRHGAIRLADVIKELSTTKVNIGEIWLLFNTGKHSKTGHIVARVYPEPPISFSIDYALLLDKGISQADFLKEERGIDKKVTYRHMGKAFVPLS